MFTDIYAGEMPWNLVSPARLVLFVGVLALLTDSVEGTEGRAEAATQQVQGLRWIQEGAGKVHEEGGGCDAVESGRLSVAKYHPSCTTAPTRLRSLELILDKAYALVDWGILRLRIDSARLGSEQACVLLELIS